MPRVKQGGIAAEPYVVYSAATMSRSILYVDGFNFYYGVTDYWRDTENLAGLGWCDFRALVERHFARPGEQLVTVKYFTAPVGPSQEIAGRRKGENVRYGEWRRAVRTIAGIQVIEGYYQVPSNDDRAAGAPNKVWENRDAPPKARLEKQTDVNLAVEVLLDACQAQHTRPEKVYVLSGDHDMMPVAFALQERLDPPVQVAILLPSKASVSGWRDAYDRTSRRLTSLLPPHRNSRVSRNVPEVHLLTREILSDSLLPYDLRDDRGEFQCRGEWRIPPQRD